MAQPEFADQRSHGQSTMNTVLAEESNTASRTELSTDQTTKAERDIEALPTENNKEHDQALDRKFARRGRWGEIVSTSHADLIFIICSLTTGLCDGVIYASFGCFISMQTGNTIFVGLGASGIPGNKPYGWLKSLVSICGFFMGSLVFSNVMRAVGNRKRGTLTTCFFIQALFVFVAAAIIQANSIPHSIDNQPTSGPLFLELIPIAILAFQFGGQISASRGMGFNELPTVVLTSVYFDIASDTGLIDGISKNVKRNRRIGSVVAIVVGAIAAGWLCRSDAEMQSALWISGFLKLCIALAWIVWPASPN